MKAALPDQTEVRLTHADAAADLARACVIVLAAGRGERFLASGGTMHKLQADLHGKTVLQRTLEAAQASGCGVHVVQAAPQLRQMGDSIACGVAARLDALAWLVLPGDLPLVRAATIAEVAADVLARGGHAAARPLVGQQSGHPVGFAAGLRQALLACEGQAGAVDVWRAAQTRLLPSNDAGATWDVDTLDRLNSARAMWAENNPSVERA